MEITTYDDLQYTERTRTNSIDYVNAYDVLATKPKIMDSSLLSYPVQVVVELCSVRLECLRVPRDISLILRISSRLANGFCLAPSGG